MIIRNLKTYYSGERGAVALLSILSLAMIILIVGLAMTVSGFLQTDITHNQEKASGALFIADAGARDAYQKITRNKDYVSAGYGLAVGEGTANVVVSQNAGTTEIISTGTLGNNIKKIKAVVNTNTDAMDGKLSIVSWNEIN